MARQQCLDKENSYYHVYNRGVNKQNIFLDDFDRYYFLKLCRKALPKYEAKIHAFCLMHNHYHLLIYTSKANLSKTMKYIGETFSRYYLSKYKSLNKSGHTFMSRYGRKIIQTDEYMETLISYIHLNPVKDRFVEHPSHYRWSSYNSYRSEKDQFNLLDINTLKDFFYPLIDLDSIESQNKTLEFNLKYLEGSKKIIDSDIMKNHLQEYRVDQKTFNKLYTYCLLEWTEFDSTDLGLELGLKSSTIRKMKSDIKFEIEENNHLLQNLIYSVRKSLELF